MPHSINHVFIAFWLMSALIPVSAHAVVIFGSEAESFFEDTRTFHGDTYLDFNGFGSVDLEDQFIGQGVVFKSVSDTAGNFLATPREMVFSSLVPGTIVGTPSDFGSDDGRVIYEVRFTTPVPRASLRRVSNTNQVTEFYNDSGVLLASHQNTVSSELVGWNTTSSDTQNWVSVIRANGLVISGTRQVLYSDDLTFGSTLVAIPEPASAVACISVLILAFTHLYRAGRR